MGLSKKRRVFVEEYLKDFNGTQAAIRAGYSENGARSTASRLLTIDNISEAVEAGIEERAMSANEVLQRLASMARGDMGDFLDVNSMGIFNLDLAKAKELGLLHLVKKVKDRSVMTMKMGADGVEVETETHNFEVELHDAQAALVHLGRHHKLFTDRSEVVTEGNVTIEYVNSWRDSTLPTPGSATSNK